MLSKAIKKGEPIMAEELISVISQVIVENNRAIEKGSCASKGQSN